MTAPNPENTIASAHEEPKASLGATLVSRIRAVFSEVKFQPRVRRLKLAETLSLGEKRLVAIVEVGNQSFLLGVTAGQISLIEKLGSPESGAEKTKP